MNKGEKQAKPVNKTEWILIAVVLLSFLGSFFFLPTGGLSAFLCLIGFIPLTIYYALRVPGLLYKVILWLLMVEPIGVVAAIQHYPGANTMGLLAATSGLLFAGALFYKGFKSRVEWSPHPFYLCAVAIGAKAIGSFLAYFGGDPIFSGVIFTPSPFEPPFLLLLVASGLFLKFKEKNMEVGAHKVLNLFLLGSGMRVIIGMVVLMENMLQ